MSFNYYRNRVLKKGSTSQDRILNENKRSFDEYLKIAPTANSVIINEDNYLVSIQDVKFNDLQQQDKYMLTYIGLPISVGDFVEWNDSVWLITTKEDESIKSHQSYRLAKTNNILKWISSDNNLISKPAITSAQTLYTTGIKDEKVIEIPDGMQGIQFPYDEDTKHLKRGDCFVFNNAKYEITFYDKTTYPGLLVLICQEVSLGGNDDEINEIADRWVAVEGGGRIDRLPWLDNQKSENPEPEIPDPTEGITYSIEVQTAFPDDDPFEIWYNETIKHIAHKFVNDVEVDGNFTFELDSAELASITGTTNNSCDITAGNVMQGGMVKLTVTDVDTGEVAIERDIKIIGR